MTGRERLLRTLNNEKADRFPCQVHGWMTYYLDHILGGSDSFQAYDRFGMDYVIYAGPFRRDTDTGKDWLRRDEPLESNEEGVRRWRRTIVTPGGELHFTCAANEFTEWIEAPPVRTKDEFELFAKYWRVPEPAHEEFRALRSRVGDRGIVRTTVWGFRQTGAWQDFVEMVGTEKAIYAAMDDPDWVHHCMEVITLKRLEFIERMNGLEVDLVETGGGAASSTVISPAMFDTFCVPYDRRQHEALHAIGLRVVYHTCGGMMPILEKIVSNGCDVVETLTPPGMGGDVDLAEARRRIGNDVAFIGGYDQNEGFERGTPEDNRRMVRECFQAAGRDGGYIVSPSDHFFFGRPENIAAFADEARSLRY